MSPDFLEASCALRCLTPWERRFHEYELLLVAGLKPDEAERIVTLAAADRAAETTHELERAAA